MDDPRRMKRKRDRDAVTVISILISILIHSILFYNQVDENVTAEKPQAAEDGKEVKK